MGNLKQWRVVSLKGNIWVGSCGREQRSTNPVKIIYYCSLYRVFSSSSSLLTFPLQNSFISSAVAVSPFINLREHKPVNSFGNFTITLPPVPKNNPVNIQDLLQTVIENFI
jgi:hypothetical protein